MILREESKHDGSRSGRQIVQVTERKRAQHEGEQKRCNDCSVR